MINKLLIFVCLSFITLIFNVNSAEVKFGSAVIISSEIKDVTDPKKNKITVKNAEVRFSDGSIYNGPIKKNKINGKGKLTTPNGTVYEGKFKRNKFVNKISRKNRNLVKLDLNKGITVENQMKVPGLAKWYPADIKDGVFTLSKKGELMASQDKKAKESSGGGGSGGGSGGSGC